jgi:predicted RNA methylase
MIKDIQQVIQNLLDFYNFQDKTIISVGAGGGQFIEYARFAKHVFAIDNDKKALNKLKENLSIKGLSEKFTLIHSDFINANVKGDVVLFEFCLHEMEQAQKMIEYAKKLAKNIIIADHGVKSEWAYIADEKEKAIASWSYVLNNPIQKIITYKAEQYYDDYNQLYEKVKIQGVNSIERIKKFEKSKSFIIPMEYTFALV